jgi:hypothetical protein
MRHKGGPGRESPRHRSKKPTSSVDAPLNGSNSESLAVDLLPSAAEQEFAEWVMAQLPGVPEPRILVLLNTPKHPVEDDAQRLANEHAEPVAIADMTGRLLAYRMPQ